MYARVTMVEGLPGNDEATKKALSWQEQEVVPELETKDGFKGTYGLLDRETGKWINITLWETEDDARATQGWYEEKLKRGAEISEPGKAVGPEYYEVVVQA